MLNGAQHCLVPEGENRNYLSYNSLGTRPISLFVQLLKVKMTLYKFISSAWSSGSHSIQSLLILLLILYFPNILLKPLKTNV